MLGEKRSKLRRGKRALTLENDAGSGLESLRFIVSLPAKLLHREPAFGQTAARGGSHSLDERNRGDSIGLERKHPNDALFVHDLQGRNRNFDAVDLDESGIGLDGGDETREVRDSDDVGHGVSPRVP